MKALKIFFFFHSKIEIPGSRWISISSSKGRRKVYWNNLPEPLLVPMSTWKRWRWEVTLCNTTYVCVPGTLRAIVNPYIIHYKSYTCGRAFTISILQMRVNNGQVHSAAASEWLSWNMMGSGHSNSSSDLLCFEWNGRKSVFWVLELFYFLRSYLEVK